MARWQVVVLVVLAVLLVAAGVYLFGPWGDADLSSRPNPAKDYAEAAARIVRVQEADRDPRIADRGHSIALLHGSQTETAVVIFHGFTDSPRRVRLLAKAYYDAGANVWVPRAPYHGYEDRMTSDQSLITATKLREYADAAVDVGAGLGRRVVVAGPSGGGALSLWALAERPEVSAAVAVSPFLHPKTGLPVWEMKPLARYLAIGPDFYHWWDPVLKDSPERIAKDPNAYPRGSVRAMSAYLAFGRWLSGWSPRARSPIGSLTLVVNEHDPSIDATYNVDLARRLIPKARLRVFTIPDSAGLGHDLLDPEGENRDKITEAYGYLSEAFQMQLPAPTKTN